MAVVIRLKRLGRRNAPFYRICVADGSAPRDGRTLGSLGFYDPASPRPELELTVHVEKARRWLGHGAKPSETVASLFRRAGVYEGFERPKKTRDRSGRNKATRTRARREERKRSVAAHKEERREGRVRAKRAAREVKEPAGAAT